MRKKLSTWLLLYSLMFNQNIQCADIAEPETVNLVIFNSSIEQSKRPFPPVAAMLGQALCDNQLVICTKRLWRTFQNINNMIIQFNQPTIMQKQEYKKLFEDFQLIIPLIQEYTNRSSSSLEKITKTLKANPYWELFSSDLMYHATYEIIKARPYICKEVNDDYILFIPQELLTKSIDPSILAIAHKKHFSKNDFILGMSFSRLPPYDYLKEENITTQTTPSTANLASALNRIALKPLLWKEYADTIHEIIPKTNVFVMAHGIAQPIKIAEMSEAIFESFLQELDQSYETKSLTIVSCFAGGIIKKAIDTFKNEHYFENVPYPIILGAGLFTTFQNKSERIVLGTKDEILRSIYTINGTSFYGPEKKYNSHGLFTQFFEYLNHAQTYSIAKKPYKFNINDSLFSSEYEYTASKSEYAKAAQLFSNDTTQRLNNIFLIRFPNTATWTLLTNIRETIKEITRANSTKQSQDISIATNVQDIFLKTEYIAAPIIIKGNLHNISIIPTLINSQLTQRVDYYIEELKTSNSYTINDLAMSIFKEKTVRNLAQPFAIAIKKLTLGNNIYFDALFLIEGNTGSRFIPAKNTLQWNRALFCTYKDQARKDFGIVWNIYGIDGETIIENTEELVRQELPRVRQLFPEIEALAQKSYLTNLEQVKNFIAGTNIKETQAQQAYRKEKANKELETEKKEQEAAIRKEQEKRSQPVADRGTLIHALELASLLS